MSCRAAIETVAENTPEPVLPTEFVLVACRPALEHAEMCWGIGQLMDTGDSWWQDFEV